MGMLFSLFLSFFLSYFLFLSLSFFLLLMLLNHGFSVLLDTVSVGLVLLVSKLLLSCAQPLFFQSINHHGTYCTHNAKKEKAIEDNQERDNEKLKSNSWKPAPTTVPR